MGILSCFDGVTGLAASCGGSPPALPLESYGVNETRLAAFTDQETDVDLLIAQAEAQARAVIASDIISAYGSRVIPVTFVHDERIGVIGSDQTMIAGESGLNGLVVEVDMRRSNVVLSLSGWRFYANASAPTLTVYDLSDGSVVGTIAMPSGAGTIVESAQRVTLRLPRRAGRYFIAHNLTGWGETTISSGSCSNCTKSGTWSHGGVTAYGAHLPASTPIVASNIRKVRSTAGITLVAALSCDHSQLLCDYRDVIAPAYVAKVAEVLLRRGLSAVERINSQRINAEQLQADADRLCALYSTGLTNFVSGVHVHGDDICLRCRHTVHVRTSAP